jgi:flagellar hook assembly protein FlgD
VTIRILNSSGGEVVTLVTNSRQPAGAQSGTWDGTNPAGRRAPPGDYVVEVRARATYASKDQFECRRTTNLTLTQ